MKLQKTAGLLLALAMAALTVAPSAAADEAQSQDTYALVNIPYAEFYKAAGADTAKTDFDAVSSATNKVGNYGKSGGAFHSGVTRGTDAEGNMAAVGTDNGARNEGLIWAVKVDDLSALAALGGTEITDDSEVIVATLGRGQISESNLKGWLALNEAPAYSYYVLSESPASYIDLTFDGGSPVFGDFNVEAEEQAPIPVNLSTGTNWGNIQLDLFEAEAASDKTVNAMVFTTADGSEVGLVHLYHIWSYSDIAWKSETVSGLDGTTITGVRYYCSVKDEDLTDGAAPQYANYVYDYPLDVVTPAVWEGEVNGAFAGSSAIKVDGIPEDAENLRAKVYFTTGERGAAYYYLTPLVVDPADDDIDPAAVSMEDGVIALTPGTVTNAAGETQEYGEPSVGTEYTVEISSDNYVFAKFKIPYELSDATADAWLDAKAEGEAPQTFDAGLIAAVASVLSLAGITAAKRKH